MTYVYDKVPITISCAVSAVVLLICNTRDFYEDTTEI